MILTSNEIVNRLNKDIFINPFDETQLNPNSYDLKLHNKLLVYRNGILDCKEDNETFELTIPESGLVLLPNILYLGRTIEHTETRNLVPMLEGRSSTGRLGLNIHATAGFGDIGFKGYWTLEISVIHPLKIYPNIRVCQMYFQEPKGEITQTYKGKYQNNSDIQSSKLFLDFIR